MNWLKKYIAASDIPLFFPSLSLQKEEGLQKGLFFISKPDNSLFPPSLALLFSGFDSIYLPKMVFFLKKMSRSIVSVVTENRKEEKKHLSLEP